MALIEVLETLVDTIEMKSLTMRSQLQPGLSRLEILTTLNPLGIQPPEALYLLYEWHNGCDPYDRGSMLFGEYQFLRLQVAIQEYQAIQEFYSYPSENIQVDQCFPFASFQTNT